MAVSSSVTGEDVARELARLPAHAAPSRRQLLEDLQATLDTLSAAQYGRPAADRTSIDVAVTKAVEIAPARASRARLAARVAAARQHAHPPAAARDVIGLNRIRTLIDQAIAEWHSVHLADLQFWHRSEARLALFAILALRPAAARDPLDVAALVGQPRAGAAGAARHDAVVALCRAAARAPAAVSRRARIFILALADPFTALVSREESFPGRRIGLLIDASISMRTPFTAATLNKRAATDAAFFTTVAAAERFVRMRMKGHQRDLLGLVEFGNQAYVVTPFTSDYDNILLSISLIGDPVEFSMFPDQGTIIAKPSIRSSGSTKRSTSSMRPVTSW